MDKIRYRLLYTIRDQLVGVAVQEPGGLLIQIQQQRFEFEPGGPQLESLDYYTSTIADKPQFRHLEIYSWSGIKAIDRDEYRGPVALIQMHKDDVIIG